MFVSDFYSKIKMIGSVLPASFSTWSAIQNQNMDESAKNGKSGGPTILAVVWCFS